jgi:peptidoglycan/LPS O-acetylase OafA/YrhL
MQQQRFLMLDGLRGIAAICVMMYHRKLWIGGPGVLDHAYLAVDFFFALSGFVIAQAYGGQIGRTLSFVEFSKRRIIRLFPLACFGVLLGMLMVAGKMIRGEAMEFNSLVPTAVFSLLLLPTFWENDLWPFNPPLWSIFFELFINLVYAAIALLLVRRNLLLLIILSGAALVAATLHEGSLAIGYYHETFYAGFLRVGFSFFLGIYLHQLYRSGVGRGWRWGVLTPVLLVLCFMVPKAFTIGGIYDLVAVMALFPLMILGAAAVEPKRPAWAEISGHLSYPLYALHEPALLGVSAVFILLGHDVEQPSLPMALFRFAAVAAFAWAVLKLFDEPIRRQLSKRLLVRSPKVAPVPGSQGGGAA